MPFYGSSSSSRRSRQSPLQLLHSSNVRGLNVILVSFNLFLQLVKRDLLVFNDQIDLKLLHAKTDWDKLRGTPCETFFLDVANVGLEFFEVRFVICTRASIGSFLGEPGEKAVGAYPTVSHQV